MEPIVLDSETDDEEAQKKVPYLPPCRVCASPASGFHYGVNTCEACKGFFRRSIARTKPYVPCSGNNDCAIESDSRSICPTCRFKKCLSVGMSKSAIKTGRYTHEKRTRDTLEVKSGASVSMSSTEYKEQSSTESSNSEVTSEPLDYSVSNNNGTDAGASATETQTCPEKEKLHNACQQSLTAVYDAFRTSFRDNAYMYENPEKIEAMLKGLMEENNLEEVTEVVVHTGATATPKQREHYSRLCNQAETLKAIEDQNSSIPKDKLMELNTYKEALKTLYEIWSANVEKLVVELVRFAKQLPGFSSLSSEDQIILIKASRPDIQVLIKFKHFRRSPDAFIDIYADSQSMCLIPTRMIRLFFNGTFNPKSDYSMLYVRCMKYLKQLNPLVEHMALMCALSLFSRDREGLSAEGQALVEKLQEELIPVLDYALEKSHPKGKSMLSKYLMLLPMIRELSEYNSQSLQAVQERIKPDLSPLLIEALSGTSCEDPPGGQM